MEDNKKKIIPLVLSLIMFIGVSLASIYYIYHVKDATESSITTAMITLGFTSNSNTINESNLTSMTDQEGIENEAYEFTITNTSGIPVDVTVKLELDEANTVDVRGIRYAFYVNDELVVKDNVNGDTLELYKYDGLGIGDEITCKVIFWVDYYYDGTGEVFKASIIADARSTGTLYNPITITFNGNGGTVSEATKEVGVGNSYGTLPVPTRAGYGFDGWTTNLFDINQGTNGSIDEAGSFVASNKEYLSGYIPVSAGKNYEITVGNSMNTIGIAYYSENKNFVKIEENSNTSHVTVTPSEKGYIRFWINKDNSTNLTTTVVNGLNVVLMGKVTSTSVVVPTTNHTLNANWIANAYTVIFDKQSGSGGNDTVAVIYDAAMPTITPPSMTGYEFQGYYSSPDGGGTKYYNANGTSATPYNVSDHITLYAKWSGNSYTIQYTMNGGADPLIKPSRGIYDEDVEIGNPTSKTFTVNINENETEATIGSNSVSNTQTFAGWSSSTIGSNAKTGTNSYTSWNGTNTTNTHFKDLVESGTVTMVANWNAANISLPSISKTGYTCGYATTSDGEIVYGSNGNYTSSITGGSATLYAKCNLNVISNVIFTVASSSLERDGATTTTSLTYSGDAETITYSSSDTSIVEVDSDGVITSVGGGYATITVTLTDYEGHETIEDVAVQVSPYKVTYDSAFLPFDSATGGFTNVVYYDIGTTTISSGTYKTPITNPCNTFSAWYIDEEYNELYDTSTPANKDIIVYAKYSNASFCFSSASQHKFRGFMDSDYQLEVWGAQGGSIKVPSGSTWRGGYGGYSIGTTTLSNSETLYINVGGAGTSNTNRTSTGKAGGYNGGGTGGAGYTTETDRLGGAGGGGATHIATASGQLSSLSSNRSSILIVAGGGGGSTYDIGPGGGPGGGSNGGAGSKEGSNGVSVGGTQTAGYAFGKGGPGLKGTNNTGSKQGNGGSGSGWYGGKTASSRSGTKTNASGAGGSGYLNTSKLTNYRMYCYTGCGGANTTVVTATGAHVANKANTGTGYAKISVTALNSYRITYNASFITFDTGSFINRVYYALGTTTVALGTVKTPTNGCNTFEGWYTDKALTIPFDINEHIDENITVYAKYTNNTFCFSTAAQHRFYAFTNTTYQLEVWGAQGGSIKVPSGSTWRGGYGGYSIGTTTLSNSETLYINVGGAGTSNTNRTSTGKAGGYNGGGTGGAGYTTETDRLGGAGGGGATHIATASGQLSSLSSNRSSILIVAGGGGGSTYDIGPGGGPGGGSNGGAGSKEGSNGVSVGGTQTAGYAFGKGGPGLKGTNNTGSKQGNGGSGSGWYGGKTASSRSGTKTNASGAGGSGYLNTSKLTNYRMYCYTGCGGANTTVVTATGAHVANKANTGTGYAKITVN